MRFKFIETQDPEYEKELMLRWENLRKPLGLPPGSEVLPEDKECFHLIAVEKKEMVGCVLFHPEDKVKGRLYQMAISEDYRGKGFGRKLIGTLENFLVEKGFSQVYLYAKDENIGFYQKAGYHIEGENVDPEGLPHKLMVKHL